MRRRLLIVLVGAAVPALAAGLVRAGTAVTAAGFLRENMSPRLVAMGGLKFQSTYLNSQVQSMTGFAAYAHPFFTNPRFGLGFGAGFIYHTAGNIDINSIDGTSRSLNAETSYAGLLSLGARAGSIAVGVSPKFVRSTLVEQYSARAFAADVGALIYFFPKTWKDRVVAGFLLQNLGTKLKYLSDEHDLPRTQVAGLSVRLWEHRDYGSLLWSWEAERTLGETGRYRFGGEYSVGADADPRAFFMRGGFRVHFDGEDYSFGVGIRERNLEVSYAFVNGTELSNLHRLGIGFRFGSYRKVLPERDEVDDMFKGLEGSERYRLLELEKIRD